MPGKPVTVGDPEPFLGWDLYELTEDERRAELTRRALEREERARKRRGKTIRVEGAEDNPWGW